MCRPILILLLLCSSVFAQAKVEFEQFPPGVITAKSARVEPLADRVVVFLTDRDAGERTGGFLKVTSTEKWAVPFALSEGVELTASSVPGSWMLFAKAGKYRVIVVETDVDGRPKFTGVDVVVGTPPPINPPPVDPPPTPTPDFAALQKLSDELADKLADPSVRKVLAKAYSTALEEITAKSLNYEQALTTVAVSRFAALSAQPMTKDWNGAFLKPVGLELGKLVKVNDLAAYFKAITAIKQGLESQ